MATERPPLPPGKRRRQDTDVIKLKANQHEVIHHNSEKINEFIVKFHGPKDTCYENGVWSIRVELPDKYPFKSPSIGFMNRIYHPNIDEASGTVCLDVINQSWTPLYDLGNIFESFLPQLLTYPNASDPLNGEAASLYMHRPEEFKKKCREYVERYATPTKPVEPVPSISAEPEEKIEVESDSDDEEESSLSEYEPDDAEFEREFAEFKGLPDDF